MGCYFFKSSEEQHSECVDLTNTAHPDLLTCGYFRYHSILGSGGSGLLLGATALRGKEQGRLFAIKSVRKTVHRRSVRDQSMIELNALARLRESRTQLICGMSSFIITLHCAFEDAKNHYFVLDFAIGGTSSTWLCLLFLTLHIIRQT